MNLKSFFSLRSIALIGASSNPDKLGFQIFNKLIQSKLKVYPVNPNRKTILNHKCFKTIIDIPGPVDQAIIVLPADLVLTVVSQAVQKKVSSIVVISAGFSETGPAGKAMEEKLKKLCDFNQILLLGPNCFGYSLSEINLDVTFAQTPPPAGNIAFISQSGAIGSYLFDWAKQENLGFSKFISLGNRAGINENDLIEYLLTDQSAKVVALYLESFADGSKFLKLASQLTRVKPLVVLFGGSSKAGKKASLSHTAALSPEEQVIAAALAQSGCLQAKTIDEFADLLEIFSLEPPLIDNDLVIVTNAGGPSILAADESETVKLDLHPLSKATALKLKSFLPSSAVVSNPVDLLGDAMADRFQKALAVIVKDSLKDAFLIILTPQTMTQLEVTAEVIVNQFQSVKKPVIATFLGGQLTEAAKAILQKNHIATIDFPQKAVAYLSRLYHYWHNQGKRLAYPVRQTKTFPVNRKILNKLQLSLKPGYLTWSQTENLSRLYRLPLVKTAKVSKTNLKSIIKTLGFPLVLKSDPSQSLHRTESKALYLNLNSYTAVFQAFNQLKPEFNPVLAQPQLLSGHELFIGLKRHSTFPAMITIGSGGIYTEIYQDVASAFLPLNKALVLELLSQTKLGQILAGARGLPPVNLPAVVDLIINVSRLVKDLPQIQELDINPAIVSQDDIRIVDIKVKI